VIRKIKKKTGNDPHNQKSARGKQKTVREPGRKKRGKEKNVHKADLEKRRRPREQQEVRKLTEYKKDKTGHQEKMIHVKTSEAKTHSEPQSKEGERSLVQSFSVDRNTKEKE